MAEYIYDAWGNCTITTNVNGYGTRNPFRYRGYYFDSDLNMYYLTTRYYDPQTGRFINADNLNYLEPHAINGLNLYAYCLNNPIMCVDSSGTNGAEAKAFDGEYDPDDDVFNGGGGIGGGTAPRGTATSQNSGNARSANTTQNGSHLVGANGARIVSHTVWSFGKTERLDVENPNPGVRAGQIHYHDSNNQPYMYDFNSRQFQNPTGRLETLMTNADFMYGLKKAYAFLGEVYGGN